MSIAVDRIQNYYQYSDAEAKFYQLLNPEVQEVKEDKVEEKSCPEKESNQDVVKPKKAKKNKKKECSENVQKSEETTVKQQQSEKPKRIVVKESSKEDESLKDDSGIAESPTEPTATAAAKKKSRSKRQREKKAAEKAAAAVASQQTEVPIQTKVENVPKSEPVTPKTAQESPKPKEATANKKKKNNNKNASSEQKPVKDESKNGVSSTSTATSTLATEIAKARQHIKSSLERVDGVSNFNIPGSELLERISVLEKDNASLRGLVDGMQKLVISLEARLNKLEGSPASSPAQQTSAPAPAAKKDEDDDDVDLFGSDEEEDEEAEKLKEERVKAYAEKKSKKPVLIAKSSILLDVKPWDDETDMKALEAQVRTVEMDGMIWGASKLVPLAYGIKKLQIMCVIEDDKVSVDELQEKIQEFEDYVQSVDIAAFNKI